MHYGFPIPFADSKGWETASNICLAGFFFSSSVGFLAADFRFSRALEAAPCFAAGAESTAWLQVLALAWLAALAGLAGCG